MIKIYINCKINIDNFEKELYNKTNRSNMQIFTYKDYLEYEKFIIKQYNRNNEVKEDNEKYEIKENTYLSKLMLIEKYKKGNDFKKCVEHIIKEINNNNYKYKGKGKEVLIIMLQKILKDSIGEETEQIIKNLKGDDGEMLQIIETLREEREELKIEAIKEGKREGKREGKTEIIKEMLKRNMPIDLISEITHFSQKKIEKIANS